MKSMKVFLLFIAGLIGLTGLIVTSNLYAIQASQTISGDKVNEVTCNKWRPINVAESTSTPVLISSDPVNAQEQFFISTTPSVRSLGINDWAFREIVNTSDGLLMLIPNEVTSSTVAVNPYTSFISSYSVVLGSDTTGNGLGDSYVVPHQAKVWGWFSPATTKGGAGGSEVYCK